MVKKILVCAVLVLAVAATSSAAGLEGVYFEARGVYSNQRVVDPTLSYSPDRWEFSNKNDWVYGGGLALGYDFSRQFSVPFRVDVEYISRDTAEVSWKGDQGVFISGQFDWKLEAETEVDTLMFNLFYDFKNATAFTPYVNAGVGVAFIDWKSHYADSIGTPDISASDDSTEFAWTIGLGCSCNLTNALAFDLGYRYLDAGQAEAEYQGLDAKADMELHEVILGLRYTF